MKTHFLPLILRHRVEVQPIVLVSLHRGGWAQVSVRHTRMPWATSAIIWGAPIWVLSSLLPGVDNTIISQKHIIFLHSMMFHNTNNTSPNSSPGSVSAPLHSDGGAGVHSTQRCHHLQAVAHCCLTLLPPCSPQSVRMSWRESCTESQCTQLYPLLASASHMVQACQYEICKSLSCNHLIYQRVSLHVTLTLMHKNVQQIRLEENYSRPQHHL